MRMLKSCKKFGDLGLKAEPSSKIGPKAVVFDVENEMTNEEFMNELYESVTSADVCLSPPAAKSRIEASETKFAWSAQRLSHVSRPETNSGDSRGSKSLSNIK